MLGERHKSACGLVGSGAGREPCCFGALDTLCREHPNQHRRFGPASWMACTVAPNRPEVVMWALSTWFPKFRFNVGRGAALC